MHINERQIMRTKERGKKRTKEGRREGRRKGRKKRRKEERKDERKRERKKGKKEGRKEGRKGERMNENKKIKTQRYVDGCTHTHRLPCSSFLFERLLPSSLTTERTARLTGRETYKPTTCFFSLPAFPLTHSGKSRVGKSSTFPASCIQKRSRYLPAIHLWSSPDSRTDYMFPSFSFSSYIHVLYSDKQT